MKKIILKVIIVAIVFQQLSLAHEVSQYIKINQSYRLRAQPNEFHTFKIAKSDLLPNSKYNIKISYIGSLVYQKYLTHFMKIKMGLQFRVYWKSDEINRKVEMEFKPLDTERLYFYTDKNGEVVNIRSESKDEINQEYFFTLVGYRNTRSRDLEAKNQDFEYIMKIEEVIFDNVPVYIFQQLILCVVATIIVAYFTSVSYFKKNGFLNRIFSNKEIQEEDKKNQ
ncbi:transmembrane protein, putative (macronuclear) [Tetrahymena thermophila SB210]|uniref:Transmembrane protein, putative n=1 Tax=Tetrahymena thermophila (strain SB210) TaxID=312017 RepID=I7M8L3_TETTS|nr:transmembrane protein, putative [Tetrahymena thermophila SB210]EAR98397.2 transmembrane protein, putative [Tetrahymena thermophila SB210]|eukprot:XP_001018642.2 transmembrane protein, putative [Tetrahymena thermophila SB210]